jgi:hypothetical protein
VGLSRAWATLVAVVSPGWQRPANEPELPLFSPLVRNSSGASRKSCRKTPSRNPRRRCNRGSSGR